MNDIEKNARLAAAHVATCMAKLNDSSASIDHRIEARKFLESNATVFAQAMAARRFWTHYRREFATITTTEGAEAVLRDAMGTASLMFSIGDVTAGKQITAVTTSSSRLQQFFSGGTAFADAVQAAMEQVEAGELERDLLGDIEP